MVLLAKYPKVSEYDLSSVKRILCGAAPLSAEIEGAVFKRLKLDDIQQGTVTLYEHFMAPILKELHGHLRFGSFIHSSVCSSFRHTFNAYCAICSQWSSALKFY